MTKGLNDLHLSNTWLFTCFLSKELGGKLCIICPKHKYKISLAEGEGMYKGTDSRENPPVTRWFSKGVKQRIHTVTESNGDVYVELFMDTCWIDSDFYQGEKGKLARAAAEAAEKKSSWWRGRWMRTGISTLSSCLPWSPQKTACWASGVDVRHAVCALPPVINRACMVIKNISFFMSLGVFRIVYGIC